jgi:uridine kinase
MRDHARASEKRGKGGPLLVAIVGGSGSGKTWLAERLMAALGPNAGRLSLDDFYKDHSHLSMARRERLNFDHPRAIDWPSVRFALYELAQGRTARTPCYDFETHCRLPRLRICRPMPVILMDGLWLIQRRSIRTLFDFSIFLDCSARIRLARRLERDLRARGRSATSVRRQFQQTVQPMHAYYVAPQSRFADVLLRGQCTRQQVRQLAAVLSKLVNAKCQEQKG